MQKWNLYVELKWYNNLSEWACLYICNYDYRNIYLWTLIDEGLFSLFVVESLEE